MPFNHGLSSSMQIGDLKKVCKGSSIYLLLKARIQPFVSQWRRQKTVFKGAIAAHVDRKIEYQLIMASARQ